VYPEEEQFTGNLDIVQYPTEQFPDQTELTAEEEHQSDLPEVFTNQYPAQYQKNEGHNKDRSKHTWNVDAPSYRPQASYQNGQCSQQADLVPSHAVNPDWYKHNVEPDPVDPVPNQSDNPDWYKHTWNTEPEDNPIKAAEPVGVSEVEGRVFWSDLSEIKATGWVD
jgi:hypothetical protein